MIKLLEVRELVISFGQSFRVGPISFGMSRGVLLVEGPNGGGKTTLLRAMSGELVPSGGEVLVAGQSVHKSVDARRQIALVPSFSELPGFLSVGEAYEFTASIRGVPGWDGATFCAELGLDPMLPLGNASAGQRQKAELVCGLAGDPRILLLDESFTHLDNESAKKLSGWITKWSSSRLILLTHHGDPPVTPDATLKVIPDQVVFESCG